MKDAIPAKQDIDPIYQKRTIYRLLGPNKRVKLKESPFEVLANPVGVDSVSLLEAQTIMLRSFNNKLAFMEARFAAIDELLNSLLPAMKEAASGSEVG